MGDAALRAAVQARDQLFEQAVPALDAPPARMELAEGKVRVKGEPARVVPVAKLIGQAMAARGPIVGQGHTGNYPRVPGFGAHMAEVEVDPETGQVRLLRYVASQDVGIAINPLAVDGQIQGGVAQGIGMALGEALIFRAGRIANAGFLDYKIPSAMDLPSIETIVLEAAGPDGPFGAKGIGEPPIVPVAAAIASAIYAATGVRITALPITPEKLRQALRERERSPA
jgi:CO/xanthine dehydrogenase Mo-binding subunit